MIYDNYTRELLVKVSDGTATDAEKFHLAIHLLDMHYPERLAFCEAYSWDHRDEVKDAAVDDGYTFPDGSGYESADCFSWAADDWAKFDEDSELEYAEMLQTKALRARV